MRRMLINDNDAVRCLGNDIGVMKLGARRAERMGERSGGWRIRPRAGINRGREA